MKLPHRLFSHLAVFAIGGAIAFAASRQAASPERRTSEATIGKETASSGETTGKAEGRERSARPVSREEFRAAWDAFSRGGERRPERLPKQKMLLAAWAEIDLEGALDAAMAEAWDNDDESGRQDHELLDAFDKVFAARPLDAWALIQSGKYGLGAALIRSHWASNLANSDGSLLVSMLGEFQPGFQKEAIEHAVRCNNQEPEEMRKILARIAAFPPGPQRDEWLIGAAKGLPDGGDTPALREKWQQLAEGPDRLVARMAWAASLRRADRGLLLAEWEKVPAGDRQDAAASLLTQLEWRAGSLTTVLDLALEAGQWETLAQTGPELLRSEAFLSDSGALATWAAKLPDRPESPALFREAVDRFLGQDLPRAKAWIGELPAGGWQQEQALAAFSRQALRQQGDTGAADWALEQISDPALREEAAAWRRDWEKSRGKPAAALK
jgi:hypothetical protein